MQGSSGWECFPGEPLGVLCVPTPSPSVPREPHGSLGSPAPKEELEQAGIPWAG